MQTFAGPQSDVGENQGEIVKLRPDQFLEEYRENNRYFPQVHRQSASHQTAVNRRFGVASVVIATTYGGDYPWPWSNRPHCNTRATRICGQPSPKLSTFTLHKYRLEDSDNIKVGYQRMPLPSVRKWRRLQARPRH